MEVSQQTILLMFFERLKMLQEIKNPISPSIAIKPMVVPENIKLSNLEEIDVMITQLKQISNGK